MLALLKYKISQIRETGGLMWKMHELVWISIITAIAILRCCWNWITMTPVHLQSVYLVVYGSNQTPFSGYFVNVWIPQMSSLFVMYVSWYVINGFIIPGIRLLMIPVDTKRLWNSIGVMLLQVAILVALVLSGTNIGMWLGHPYLFNHSGFHVASLFVYKDYPLVYVMYGFSDSLRLTVFLLALALVREYIIWYMENKISLKAYRMHIVNQCTAFITVYLLILYILTAFNYSAADPLFAVIMILSPSVFGVFMTGQYWVFPLTANRSFLSFPTGVRLLLSTFICTFPVFMLKDTILPHHQFLVFLWCCLGQLLITTPVSWQLYRWRKDRIARLKGMEEELRQTQADLQSLRSQVNPHFLFNALNTIYGIALREKSTDTATAVQMLGDMMRFMLHENANDFIPMHKEIEYLENFIALQKLRVQLSPLIRIEETIDRQHCSGRIAPMLLLPFIENAFKHGIHQKYPSWISIALTCDGQGIQLQIRNSQHLFISTEAQVESSGIGLKNVTERLQLLYPGRHQLTTDSDGREFYINLKIDNLSPAYKQ